MLDLLFGQLTEADLTPGQREWVRATTEQDRAESLQALEGSTAGRLYREQLTRLGVPQPEALEDIDVVEEAIRLVGLKPEDVGTGRDEPTPRESWELLPEDDGFPTACRPG